MRREGAESTNGMIRTSALMAAVILLSPVAHAQKIEVLFPSPVHLTREIEDPVSGTRVIVEEYLVGNRMISVAGDVTVIADYGTASITRIDRAARTFSISTFDEYAATRREEPASASTKKVTSLGSTMTSGRSGDEFLIETEGRSTRIVADSSVRMSKSAAEILLGIAYPNRARGSEMLDALRATPALQSKGMTSDASMYSLPVEVTTEIDVAGETVRFSEKVTRVGSELPPAHLLEIPAGATRVELASIAAPRQLEELDRLPKGND